MQCLKCGKETADERTFCQSCMEEMEKYPVKPGTPVQLPIRSNAELSRKPSAKKRSNVSEKEQIAKLTRRNRLLSVLLLLMMTALMFVTVVLVRSYYKAPTRPTGQNYSTVSSETAPQS